MSIDNKELKNIIKKYKRGIYKISDVREMVRKGIITPHEYKIITYFDYLIY